MVMAPGQGAGRWRYYERYWDMGGEGMAAVRPTYERQGVGVEVRGTVSGGT